jgi:hypothetical protein
MGEITMRRGLFRMVELSGLRGSSSKNPKPGIQHRRLLGEMLEARRLLSIDPWNSAPEASNVFTDLPGLSALRFASGQQSQAHLDQREMLFLAEGPDPSQLAIDVPHNRNAADTTNADQLRSGGGLGLNLTGSGYTVGIWEATENCAR